MHRDTKERVHSGQVNAVATGTEAPGHMFHELEEHLMRRVSDQKKIAERDADARKKAAHVVSEVVDPGHIDVALRGRSEALVVSTGEEGVDADVTTSTLPSSIGVVSSSDGQSTGSGGGSKEGESEHTMRDLEATGAGLDQEQDLVADNSDEKESADCLEKHAGKVLAVAVIGFLASAAIVTISAVSLLTTLAIIGTTAAAVLGLIGAIVAIAATVILVAAAVELHKRNKRMMTGERVGANSANDMQPDYTHKSIEEMRALIIEKDKWNVLGERYNKLLEKITEDDDEYEEQQEELLLKAGRVVTAAQEERKNYTRRIPAERFGSRGGSIFNEVVHEHDSPLSEEDIEYEKRVYERHKREDEREAKRVLCGDLFDQEPDHINGYKPAIARLEKEMLELEHIHLCVCGLREKYIEEESEMYDAYEITSGN